MAKLTDEKKRLLLIEYGSKLTEGQIKKFGHIYGLYNFDTFDDMIKYIKSQNLDNAIRLCEATITKNEKNGVYMREAFKELGLDGLV